MRLKDLIISGNVWIDKDKNGTKDSGEDGLKNVKVILHDVTNDKTEEITTDSNGDYNFGRIAKATKKDTDTKNYKSTDGYYKEYNPGNETNSEYIKYYIEFEYDGIKYQSTEYSGRNNLTDGSANDTYKIDSNAAEFNSVREEFNKALETIYYNKGMEEPKPGVTDPETINLEYTLLKDTSEEHDNEHIAKLKDNIKMIKAVSFIDVSKSEENGIDYLWLHKTTATTDNFEDYLLETEYLQYINLGLIEKKLDLNISKDVYEIKTTINGDQMTYKYDEHGNIRGTNGEITSEKYITGGEDVTESPYKHDFYKSDYTYRYTNYATGIVQTYKKHSELNAEITYKIKIVNTNQDNKRDVYAIVRELTDYYSKDYKEYGEESTTISVLQDGLLKDEEVENVKAWYYDGSTKHDLLLNKTAKYTDINGIASSDNYNKIYITPNDGDILKLKEGETLDIYIKYVLDKDTDGNIKIGEKASLTEINAYSTYIKNSDSSKQDKPAGYVDINSNPGDIKNNDLDSTSEYQNDTYKTRVKFDKNPDDYEDDDGKLYEYEREIKGFVWDDARSSKALYKRPEDLTLIEPKDGIQYIGNGEYNTADEAVKDEKGKIIPKINTRLGTKEKNDSKVKGVNVDLVELIEIPLDAGGNVITNGSKPTTSVTYEETRLTNKTNNNGEYVLNSFIPGRYIVRFNYGDDESEKDSNNELIFNGQDYKSTTFKTGKETGDNMNEIIKFLEDENKSDARDDEIRRLDVISYSEIMNNKITEVLQQKGKPEEKEENTQNRIKEFISNTKMHADTIEFIVRPEKLADYKNYDKEDPLSYAKLDHISYAELYGKNLTPTYHYRFLLNNFDFGLQYRPEVKLELKKYLSEIKAIKSDGTDLADIKFDNIYKDNDSTKAIIGTKINENSKGYENLQYLASALNTDKTKIDTRGFAYLNIDEELLQGLTIKIKYVFSTINSGEIDRIGKKLDELKYENNKTDTEDENNKTYKASEKAKEDLIKTYCVNNDEKQLQKSKKAYNGTEGYYGQYLGTTYYTGEDTGEDTVASLKVDKIIDYVDNNLTFRQEDNKEAENKWEEIISEELSTQGLVSESVFYQMSMKAGLSNTVKTLFDFNNISYDTNNKHNIVISVDDRKVGTNINQNLLKFTVPEKSSEKNSSGTIYITTSKVLSSEEDTDKMTFDNAAEIVQYTTLTGRITNLNATIGNVNMSEFNTENSKIDEPDSYYTERVVLAPPTGIELTKYYISLWSHQIRIIITGVLVITVIFIGYKNRSKIKALKPKKFYK